MIMFLELPASLYLKFDKPSAASIAHIKQRRAATMTSGTEARKPPTLPVTSNFKLLRENCYCMRTNDNENRQTTNGTISNKLLKGKQYQAFQFR